MSSEKVKMDVAVEVQHESIAIGQERLEEVKPVAIECHGLYVQAKNKKKTEILKDVSCTFLPGTTTALMGPSGAGKTTLLNVLSGRRQSLKVSFQEILVNGKKLSAKKMQQFSSLVPQDDVLIAILSPRETFYYAARLLLDATNEQVIERVNQTLKVLSLEDCADTKNGDYDIKGISGGERKRVSIGVELISNPSCLFLDEPTSGLDSKVAMDVVKILEILAEQGRTIICTIHQPSVDIFRKFERLLLLSKGTVAFQGEVKKVGDYFDTIGLPVPLNLNPADHMLHVLAVATPSTADTYAQAFEKSEYGRLNKTFAEKVKLHYEPDNDLVKTKGKKLLENEKQLANKAVNSSLWKFWVLFRRSSYVAAKDTKQLRTRTMQIVVICLIVGLTFFQLPKIQTAIFDRQSSLLMVTIFTVMSNIMTTIHHVPMEKTILRREYQNGYYSAPVYTGARLLVLYLFQIFYCSLYAVLVYNLIGFHPGVEHFFIFLATLYIGACIAVTFGLLFGTLFPTIQGASAVVPTIIMPFMLFSGLLIAPENIPVYFIWLYYLSFLQYIFQILLVNEFRDFEFQACSLDDRLIPGDCPLGACNEDPFNITIDAEPCPGSFVLESAGYSLDDQPINFGVLLAYLAFAIAGCFVVLYRFLKS